MNESKESQKDWSCPHEEFRVDIARTALLPPCPQCFPEEYKADTLDRTLDL